MISASTNSAAMTAQRYLSSASSNASSSIAKLSSGSRIVKASDDAASLAIGNKLRADVSALEQASRNASQGASLIQVATGALDRLSDILTRMKTLSTQAVNGTLSSSELSYADTEYQQLLEQIDTVANNTRFNGNTLLSGSASSAAAATVTGSVVGTDDLLATTVTTNVVSTAANILSSLKGYISGRVENVTVTAPTTDIYQIDITVGGQVFTGYANNTIDGSVAVFKSETMGGASFELEIDAQTLGSAAATQTELRSFFGTSNTLGGSSLRSSGVNTGITGVTASAGSAEAGTYGLMYVINGNGDGGTFHLSDGTQTWSQDVRELTSAQSVSFGNGFQLSLASTFNYDTSVGNGAGQVRTYTVTAGSGEFSTDFQIGEKTSDTITVTIGGANASSLGVASTDVTSQSSAQTAATAIDAALATVNTRLASLGAVQSRFEFVQANISTTVENLKAAKGTFTDVDMSKEMTDFTKNQTLLQAGVAMLSQANQMPQMMLRLLQG